MHKLLEYVCEELEELERKADKDGKLSMAEMQYVDLLAHTKKNLLKAEEMSDDMEYSGAMGDGMSYEGGYRSSYARGGQGGNRGGGNRSGRGSYARGRGRNARRDSMGRYSSEGGYSRAGEEMIMELREMMEDAPDDRTRKEFERFIQKMEQM